MVFDTGISFTLLTFGVMTVTGLFDSFCLKYSTYVGSTLIKLYWSTTTYPRWSTTPVHLEYRKELLN